MMAEKLWRMDVQNSIDAFVRGSNKELKDKFNIKNSMKDIKYFQLIKRSSIEEDIFKYFYPFCLVNSVVMTCVILRKNSWITIVCGIIGISQYNYHLFSFPVESWHFHKRAISTDKEYA